MIDSPKNQSQKPKPGPYINPFSQALQKEGKSQKEESKIPTFDSPRAILIDIEYKPVYKWKTELSQPTITSIETYKKKYEQFLKLHNNTVNKQVWDIYDHMTDDLFNELFKEASKDLEKVLDSYLDAVIKKEFAI